MTKPVCRQCGNVMKKSSRFQADIPFEISVMLIDLDLSPHAVDYYRCPKWHTHLWRLPLAELGVAGTKEVSVTRRYSPANEAPM